MQVRDALERSLEDMEAFFSQFEPLADEGFAKAIRGVDAVGAAPAFNVGRKTARGRGESVYASMSVSSSDMRALIET